MVLAIALGSGCCFLQMDGTTGQIFADRSGDFDAFEEFKANFGGDEWIAVVATGPSLYREDSLKWLQQFAEELGAREEVGRVESVFTLARYERRGQWTFSQPLITSLPRNEAEAGQLRSRLLEDARSRGRLINESGDSLCFLIELDDVLAAERGESRLVSEVLGRCTAAAAETPEGLELFAVGVPLIHLEMKAAMKRDIMRAVPLALFAMWLGTLPFLRGWTSLLPLLVTCPLAAISTLGFIGWTDFPMTIVLLPSVALVVVITSAEGIYILSEFREGLRLHLSREQAITRLGKRLGLTILITAVTSAAGFAAVALTSNVGLQRFAITGAAGILFGLVFTVLTIPALLALLPPPEKTALRLPGILRKIRRGITALAADRRRRAGFVCLVILLTISAGIPKINIDTSFLDYLPDDSPLLRNVERFREAFGGLSFVSVALETGEAGGINRRQTLLEMDRFQTFLAAQGGTAHSYLDVLEEMSRWFGTVTGKTPPALLERENLDEFLATVPGEFSRPFLDHDASRTCFKLRIHAPNSRALLDLEKVILAYPLDGFPPGTTVEMMGSRMLVARFSERIVRELLASSAALSLLIAGVLALALRSVRLGAVALVPNALPILATLGLMGWTGIPLSLGTFHVSLIAFGIAINDTLHLMLRYREKRASGCSRERASRDTLHEKCVPILATSVVLSSGFAALLLCELSNLRDSGILLIFAMIAAAAADLFVTPMLLGWGKKTIAPGLRT
jgi:uncharacterized protein